MSFVPSSESLGTNTRHTCHTLHVQIRKNIVASAHCATIIAFGSSSSANKHGYPYLCYHRLEADGECNPAYRPSFLDSNHYDGRIYAD